MSDTAPTRKQLKIKAGVVKRFVASPASLDTFPQPRPYRYQKELALYRAEVVQNEAKLESIKASEEGAESWDARNMVRAT
jgi:hypothetical protein